MEMKKKPFLLLEILIAFFLVSLCAVPLIRQPLEMVRTEIKKLEEMEMERLADWTFTEVKEMLLKNEIPWKKIPEKGEKSALFTLPPAKIQLPKCKPRTIRRKFELTGRGMKTSKKGDEYRQLGIYIHLEKKVYQFRMPVQKVLIEK